MIILNRRNIAGKMSLVAVGGFLKLENPPALPRSDGVEPRLFL
jgi:hypothetical protein